MTTLAIGELIFCKEVGANTLVKPLDPRGPLAQPYLQVSGRQLAPAGLLQHGPRGCWDMGTLAPNTNG
ncbi:unnamed protein product [Lota lota]